MRNLASIQTVKSLEPISGKDRILYASFVNTGWRVITDTSFHVGDLVVYCEVDSLLPVKPEFEFLRPRCYVEKWNAFRIKNMKMCGLYSEGIVFPLSILGDKNKTVRDGDDVTEILGVTKYDPESLEENKNQKKKSWLLTLIYRTSWLKKLLIPRKESGGWPQWISKTDETRAQSLNYIYEKYQGIPFYSSEKIDGQSCGFSWKGKKFGVYSRNLSLGSRGDTRYHKTAELLGVEDILKRASKKLKIDLYIQGEQAGPGIQGNKYNFTGTRFFVFNIKNITHGTYFSLQEIQNFCRTYNLEMVPVLEKFNFQFKSMEELLEYSRDTSVFNSGISREGVVLRPQIPLPADRGQANMCSFKVINPDFDLKYNK